MVELFRSAAESEKFVVVAPDSRRAPNGQFTWEVPNHQDDTSGDRARIRACVEEVLAMSGVQIDPGRTFIAGHSGGASTAPYTASVDEFYTAYAVLHGGVSFSSRNQHDGGVDDVRG
jgi:poly(3-hydroxybutyrate) depolymerase